MERAVLGISLRDRVRNEIIREKTKGTDIIKTIIQCKWNTLQEEIITDALRRFYSSEQQH